MRSATRKETGKDAAYLAWLHTLPCVCCELLRMRLLEAGLSEADCVVQTAPTEAAHVGDRGMSQRCPDRQAIPLCGHTTHMDGPASGHHREGPASAHKLQTKFWSYWDLDRDVLIETLNATYDEEHGAVLNACEVVGIAG